MSMIISLSANALSMGSADPEKDSCKLIAFTIKQVDQKNYLNWFVLSDMKDYYFILERSTDGENFKPVYMTSGAISPANQKLQFSFIDKFQDCSKTVYRICAYRLHFSDNDTQILDRNETNMFGQSSKAVLTLNTDFALCDK